MNLPMAPRNWIPRSALAMLAAWAALAIAQAAETAAAGKTIELEVVGGKPAGGARTVQVSVGERIALKVVSDRKLGVHVHGYDAHADLVPGTPATIQFDARWVGRFPVTAHLPGAKGSGHHGTEPTLLYLEVRPK
jgi:hypothetical protein